MTAKRPPGSPQGDPGIRWSKVMIAQGRIAEGYYDREDVRELLLSAVLNELTRH